MRTTQRVADFINEQGISLNHLAQKTHISYGKIVSSLSPNGRGRDLRADELLSICLAIGKNPMDFAPEEHE